MRYDNSDQSPALCTAITHSGWKVPMTGNRSSALNISLNSLGVCQTAFIKENCVTAKDCALANAFSTLRLPAVTTRYGVVMIGGVY